MKTSTGRHSTAPSLYRLAFDDVVSDLLNVKPAATLEAATQKAEARLKTARKGQGGKGKVSAPYHKARLRQL